MGNLKNAIAKATQNPDEITLSALVDAADKSLTENNVDKLLPSILQAMDKAMQGHLWEYALGLAAIVEKVSPDNLNILRRVAECLMQIGDNVSALGIADRLYTAADALADRIQAQHLIVKLLAQGGGRLDEARDAKDHLGVMIQSLMDKAPEITLDQLCWIMGSVFWFCGYFDDDPGDRAFINRVAEWSQSKVLQCI